jgi:hypothetical protein
MNSAPFIRQPNPSLETRIKFRQRSNLPLDAPFCAVLGRLFKVHPDFSNAVIDLLNRVPEAVVVLVAERHDSINDELLARFRSLISVRGLSDDVSTRVRLLPYNDFLGIIQVPYSLIVLLINSMRPSIVLFYCWLKCMDSTISLL